MRKRINSLLPFIEFWSGGRDCLIGATFGSCDSVLLKSGV